MVRWWMLALTACHAPTPTEPAPTGLSTPPTVRPPPPTFPSDIPPVVHSPNTVRGHAEECTQALGPIPGFDCLDDADAVPVVVDGVRTMEVVDRCDAPSLLEGTCNPFTRVGAKQGTHFDGTPNPDVTFVFTCRSSDTEPPTNAGGIFHDVAMIGHHARTGATCYFQSFPGDEERVRAFPSPLTAGEDPDVGEVDAAHVWELPARTADSRCVRCHAADPWIHTPWIDQLARRDAPDELLVPLTGGIDTPYHIVGEAFTGWQMAHFDLPDNGCTSCHRVGTEGCDNFVRYSTGGVSSVPLSPSADGVPWMPPESPTDPAAWDADVDVILSCCMDPSVPECNATPVWEGYRYTDPNPVTPLPTPVTSEPCGAVDGRLVDTYRSNTCGQTADHDNPCGAADTPDRAVVWVAPAAGRYVFDTTGSDFNTVLVVRSTCADGNTFLTCNDDIDDGVELQSRVTYTADAGEEVVVVMEGYGAHDCGPVELSVTAL